MIHPSSIVENAEVHKSAFIGPMCLIGMPAEKIGFWPGVPFGVVIEKDVVIHGQVSVDAGTWRETRIGEGTWVMKKTHCGHDCVIGKNVFIATLVSVGGHVEIGDGANIGMGAVIHAWQRIPPYCMIGLNAAVTKHLELKPFCIYAGNPAKFIKYNAVGMERSGLSREQIDEITKNWLHENQKPT